MMAAMQRHCCMHCLMANNDSGGGEVLGKPKSKQMAFDHELKSKPIGHVKQSVAWETWVLKILKTCRFLILKEFLPRRRAKGFAKGYLIPIRLGTWE